jgi:hypothetical protein
MWQYVPHTLQSSHHHCPHLAHQSKYSHPSFYFRQCQTPSTNSPKTTTPIEWQTCLCTQACPSGHRSINLLLQNLWNHTVPNTLAYKENAIGWFSSLLLNQTHANNMTGFDNGILFVYGMCPPVELMQYYQMDPTQGTATKVWGDDLDNFSLFLLFCFLFSVIYFTAAQ